MALPRAGTTSNCLRTGAFFLTGRLFCCYLIVIVLGILFCSSAVAQQIPRTVPSVSQPELPKDSLGRSTPRGTVYGFLNVARRGNDELAAQYLNTRLRGKSAANLAHDLFVVLDRRLPAKLNELSDKPEGSQADPLQPNVDRVGKITSSNGDVDILLERVDLGKVGYLWLFSSRSLELIPNLYKEVILVSPDSMLPQFLVNTRVADVPLFEWLALLVGVPFAYLLAFVLSRLLSPPAGRLHRHLRKNPDLPNPDVIPAPVRLLLIAFIIRWAISKVTLSLLARQFWSSFAIAIIIFSCVWLFIRLNGQIEELIRRRLLRSNSTGAVAVSRLVLRVIDVLAVFVGALIGLNHFGLSPTAALAGLGVGGIAVALAAQKTLENVIGGVSVIIDQTVRVGDSLKVGETSGTVDDIGLRSTRIRTLDRSMVSVPNGQIANASLENVSVRDKFWFHPNLYLRYDTTPTQIRLVLDGIKELLAKHLLVENESVRVSFVSAGTSALEIAVSAYLFARDWGCFLEIQSELNIRIMEIVEAAGSNFAQRPFLVQVPAADRADPNRTTRGVSNKKLN